MNDVLPQPGNVYSPSRIQSPAPTGMIPGKVSNDPPARARGVWAGGAGAAGEFLRPGIVPGHKLVALRDLVGVHGLALDDIAVVG